MTRKERIAHRTYLAMVPRHKGIRITPHYGSPGRWNVWRGLTHLGYVRAHFVRPHHPSRFTDLDLPCTIWWSAHPFALTCSLYPSRRLAVHMVIFPHDRFPWTAALPPSVQRIDP